MSKLQITSHDAITGVTETREMTDEEYASYLLGQEIPEETPEP